MINVVFQGNTFSQINELLLRSNLETCAIALAKVVNEGEKLLVMQVHHPHDHAYIERTEVSAKLAPEYLVPIVKQASLEALSIIFLHSHPGLGENPTFSYIDRDGEVALQKFLENRHVQGPNIAIVVNRSGCQARQLATDVLVRVTQVGANLDIIYSPFKPIQQDQLFDRQVRAFGEEGQEKLRRVKVGIVGLGGTGSLVAQQLAHLGVREHILIDPDIIEESNLNRLAGASLMDIGCLKTKIAKNYIKSLNPLAAVATSEGSILDASIVNLLLDTDFLFCCTDSHGSRVVINQLSYQYFIPCIDMGVSITSKDEKVTHITGRVQMLSPGLSCLTCSNLLDSEAVRRDFMSAEHRQADPYIIGDPQPQPAVISINTTMASLAVTMFLGAVTGIPAKSRYQIYNGITGNVRSVVGSADPTCIVCSKRGALGKGNDWPLPTRQI